MLQFGERQVEVAGKLAGQKAGGTRRVPATMGAFTTFRSVDYHQVEHAGSMVVRS
jgi:hypothetical protein